MMQHKMMTGQQIAIGTGERFEDRMKRIAMSYRSDAAVKAGDDSPWLTLRVDPGREKIVKSCLDEEGIEALVPMRKGPELRRRGRVLPAVMTPVMICYVLVRCRVSERAMLGLKSFDHVRDVLGGCLTPRLVSAYEVNAFRVKAEEGQYDWENPVTIFKRGWKVRPKEGSFSGFTGTVIACRSDGKGDAVIEIDIFGRMTPVTLPLALLEKV